MKNKAPERIWIEEDDCPYFYVESELADAGSPVTEYVRADKLEELAAKNRMLEDYVKDLKDGKRITESEVYGLVSALAEAKRALVSVVDSLDGGNGYRPGSLKKFTRDVLGVQRRT